MEAWCPNYYVVGLWCQVLWTRDTAKDVDLKPCCDCRVSYTSRWKRRKSPFKIFVSWQGSRMGRAVEVVVFSWFPCFQDQYDDGLFLINGISTLTTYRFKSSARKTAPCGPRWQRQSIVSLPCRWDVKSQGIYVDSTSGRPVPVHVSLHSSTGPQCR